jgi:hypothetical protein
VSGSQAEVILVSVEPITFAMLKQVIPRFWACSNAFKTSFVSPDWLTKMPTSCGPTVGRTGE